MIDNSFAQSARLTKATKLFTLCVAWDIRSFDVNGFSEESWGLLAHAARVNKPSEETRSIVIQMLRDKELAGVPKYATTL